MKFYSDEIDKVFDELKSSADGLSAEEAKKRAQTHGKNKLADAKKIPLWKRFLSQFADPMIIVLIVAAAISAVTSFYEGESFADVFIILFVVILNAVLGVIQESKAEKAIDALMEMSAQSCRVVRGGETVRIPAEDLVPGDIVLLEAGDAVPADGRIIESASLKIEEAALTGESVPVEKSSGIITSEKEVPLGDRKNMVYTGSSVVYGRGCAVITGTGMNTEMGKIAHAITQASNDATPLQIKLNQLSKMLTWLVLGICVFIFAFALIREGDYSAKSVISTFMIAVSLAVAAIPEGLAAVVTIVLSIGVTKMSKRNAIIRSLTAVETLGCTQVICSDKTGTLTQNKMTVTKSYTENEELLARAMALCSDAEIDSSGNIVGEPTECALVAYAASLSLPKTELKTSYPRIGEAPFDSERKMMSTVHNNNGEIIQFTKGAPDELLKVCTHAVKNGQVVPITDRIKQEISEKNKEFADMALRVLAAAYKTYDKEPSSYSPELEKELVFIGLTGMIDPVRPEVVEAMDQCRNAGIRPVMITGDHRDTAAAIAKELGILEDPSQAITGSDLNEMSDSDLEKNIGKYCVYARVQPEHKVRIVKAWKKNDMVTAMTGDGVNDAPAIKNADIGIGMGITGTDVTKNCADMVLADDNFATIVSAVGEGRRIYDNIKKAIQFLLSSNLSEVLSIFAATMLGFTILNPVHILWINLITDSFPALALGMEHAESDVMNQPPRPKREGLFANGMGFHVIMQGIMVSVLTLLSYFIGHYIESGVWEIAKSADGITMAFLTMANAEVFHSLNLRSKYGSIFKLKRQNVYLLGAMALSLVLTAAIIFIPPLANLFEFTHISLFEYIVSMLLAVSVIPIIEITKIFMRARRNRK